MIFKASALAREAFIAARFEVSAVTDTYFGLQQFPVTLATFMLGAFVLAFAPAYSTARKQGGPISWTPGILVYGIIAGGLPTLGMLAASSPLLSIFSKTAHAGTWETLAVLSLCFAPIVWIGIWAGICTASRRNIWAMSTTGLPYGLEHRGSL